MSDPKKPLWYFLSYFFMILILWALIASPVWAQVEEECTTCHSDVSANLRKSEHDFLSCTSCHTDIKSFPHQAGASLDKRESVATCAGCHTGRIAESYKDSYHGKAVHLGSQKSASCVDCHGSHDVLGPDNPNSRVAKENVPETCATCHRQAAPGFAEGNDHYLLASTGSGAPMYYTAKFFIWLTVLTIVGMVIHIELQLYHNLRRILKERKRR